MQERGALKINSFKMLPYGIQQILKKDGISVLFFKKIKTKFTPELIKTYSLLLPLFEG